MEVIIVSGLRLAWDFHFVSAVAIQLKEILLEGLRARRLEDVHEESNENAKFKFR